MEAFLEEHPGTVNAVFKEICLPSIILQAIDVLVPPIFEYQRIQLSKEVSLHLKKEFDF